MSEEKSIQTPIASGYFIGPVFPNYPSFPTAARAVICLCVPFDDDVASLLKRANSES